MDGNSKHNKLKLAFLTPEYPHELGSKSAGLGSSIRNLATALVAKGHDVTIFIYGQQNSQVINNDGIELHFIKQKKTPLFGWWFSRKHIQNYVNEVVKVKGIQLVETQDWTGIAAFMDIHCKFIIRLHGSDAYFCNLDGRKQKKKNYWLEKKGLENVDHIVSVSDFAAKETKRIFGFSKSITTIYNGIDTNAFSKKKAIPIEKGILLYFGTIIRKKGVLELAKIFNIVVEQNSDAKLVMLGKDSIDVFENRSTIAIFKELLSEEAKQKVSLVSEVPYEEVVTYLAKANVIVLPSFAEAFPMTWLEAMAAEKALVTSNVGWADEMMIDGKTGFTVDPNNHKQYAARINELLVDLELSKTMGTEARNHVVEHFSADRIVEDNIRYYSKLLTL